jgi:hypothetical protein
MVGLIHVCLLLVSD